jgi:hypothetical protein
MGALTYEAGQFGVAENAVGGEQGGAIAVRRKLLDRECRRACSRSDRCLVSRDDTERNGHDSIVRVG